MDNTLKALLEALEVMASRKQVWIVSYDKKTNSAVTEDGRPFNPLIALFDCLVVYKSDIPLNVLKELQDKQEFFINKLQIK